MVTFLRWVLPLFFAANGVFMLAAPEPWYGAIPGVTETGPYNPHFIRDIGAAYIAAAAGLGWWAAGRGIGGAVAAAVFLGLHMFVHLFEALIGHHPASDVGRDFVGVYLPTLIVFWIVWRDWKREA
ncbi:MAG TPA: hypothetical protein VD906_16510 [Caulobacteraceae bacterium]|nr:hypothetical protein [Caulobacteraceae bacterium]